MTTSLPAVADRIASDLTAYALTNLFDLLGSAIGETIADDPDSPEDGTVERDDLWDAVIARLKVAPAEYQRRDQVLTEAAALLRGQHAAVYEDAGQAVASGLLRGADLLDAARTGQETPAPASAEDVPSIRLWLIEQALAAIDASQDPAGIVGAIGPLLDGPLHPTHVAAYRARTGQEPQQ